MSQTFAALGMNPEQLAGLEELGYEQPTKLQADVIPHMLASRDVVVEAPPGSGRTAAYVLPILQTLDPEAEGVQVLVVSETGDACLRIAGLFRQLNRHPHLHIVPVFSGQPIAREAERLDQPTHLVVGTPKRLQDHVERESLSLEHVQFVVIDGDRMFSRKGLELLSGLLDGLPASRQSAIFATQLNSAVQEVTDQHLFEPVVLKREASPVSMPLIKHRYQAVTSKDKDDMLAQLLDGENVDRALVYVNLGTQVQEVCHFLQSLGYRAAAMNQKTSADERESIILNWREGSLDFIILTDAVAEDLVLETPYALSYDVSADAEAYAERSKLVAENGSLFSLVSANERRLLTEIENFLGQRVKAVLPPTRATMVAQRSEAFKQRLRDVIGRSNLEVYMLVLNELAEEGHDWSEIAAAAVSLVQHSQADTIFTRRTDRGERRSSAPRTRETPRAPRAPDEEREVEAGYVRLVMDAGYDIGVRPKDIVGAIANEANIPGRAVGNIDIRDRFTFVEVQQDYVDRVLTRVPSTRLRGRIVSFRRA